MSEEEPAEGALGLARSHEEVEELYEDAPCGFVSTAPDGTILRANRTFLAWCGYAAEELVGRRRFYDLLPPGAKIYYETHYAPLLRLQGQVRELALEVVRADGTRLPVLVNARLGTDAGGTPVTVSIILFDATERRRYERELLEARTAAEERAAAASALAHVAEAVLLVDDDGVVRAANAAAARLLDLEGGPLVGEPLPELVRGWAELAARIPLGAGESRPVLPLEVRSETRWVEAAAEAAPDGVVFTLRDVTAERRLDELRDDIVAIVSHELRTPVAGIYGAAKTLAARGAALPEEQRAALVGIVAEQSGRLSRILDEIHLAQRLDRGEVAVERRAFDVVAVVRAVSQRALARHEPHVLDVLAPERAPAVGDAALFEQVMNALLDNALVYSPPGTTVTLRVEERPGTVRTVVADEGPGISAADRERIFDRFHRLDPDQTAAPGGIGLGLAIARELVRRMRGRIGLLPSDRGAAFFVDLDAARG